MPEPTAVKRPRMQPLGLAAEFYERCGSGALHFQRCTSCSTWRHLPRAMCAKCGSPDWEWAASSGRGRIFSWTVTHETAHPAFAAETPYAAILVEMEEGVRLVSRLRGLPPEEIELDLAVEVEFERVSETVTLPYFRVRD